MSIYTPAFLAKYPNWTTDHTVSFDVRERVLYTDDEGMIMRCQIVRKAPRACDGEMLYQYILPNGDYHISDARPLGKCRQ